MPSTVILRRGRIYPMSHPGHVTTVAIRNGRVVAAGSDNEVWAAVGSDQPTVDLGGRTVLPGFTDAHFHWAGYALLRRQLALEPNLGLPEVLRRVRAQATAAKTNKWLIGRGWDQSRWGRWPTAQDLDSVVTDRPVLLTRKDGHCVWLNSAGLAVAGIGAETPDPPGGEIVRQNGRPTGVLKETAVALALTAVPEPDPLERQAAMIDAWREAWSRGLTGGHDMGFHDTALFRNLATLRDAGELGLRFVWYLPRQALDEAIGLGLRSGLGDDWLRVGGLKLFLDGTLGAQTAFMLEPYEGQPQNRGVNVLDYETYCAFLERASRAGLATAVHAIGDAANRWALDGFAQVPNGRGADGRPLLRRVEHCQIVAPEDVQRFAQLGVVASVQPVHLMADMELADRYWGARADHAYAWRALQDAGATLAFGSDAPVERLDVFAGIDAAVSRQANGYGPRGGWHPEQALSVYEAIRGYTVGPALAAGQEDSLGSLAAGHRADLIVLDRDPFTARPQELPDTGVLATMIEGVWVWQAAGVDLAGPRHDG